MDNVTHGAIGIVTGWMRRTDPRREDPDTDRAVPWAGFMAAEAPDLDVFIRRMPGFEWVGHRGITHTVVALPVTALIVALLCKLVFRRARFWVVYAWACVAMFVGHLVADVITWRGIRPFLPWSQERWSYEIMPIVDVAFSLPLVLVVLAGLLRPAWRRNMALGFSALALVYLAGRSAAYAHMKAVDPRAAAVVTGHRVVQADAGGYRVREVRWWAPWQLVERRLPRAQTDVAAMQAANALRPTWRYLRTGLPYVVVEERGDLRRITLVDLLARFPVGYPWADVDATGKVVRTGRTWFVKL